jgi:hypothetical protein
MAKYQSVNPTVEKILHARNVKARVAVLCAVANYPSLAPAHKLARIDSSKEQALYKFVCKQTAWLMKWNCFTWKPHANVTAKRHGAAKVMLTFSTPLPEKVAAVPSQHDCACVLGVPRMTMTRVDTLLIEKCW